MEEHQNYITMPGSMLFGATLELYEWESEDERIKREHGELLAALEQSQQALIQRHNNPEMVEELIQEGQLLEAAKGIERHWPDLAHYYRTVQANIELLARIK
jgi:hypothetical protein